MFNLQFSYYGTNWFCYWIVDPGALFISITKQAHGTACISDEGNPDEWSEVTNDVIDILYKVEKLTHNNYTSV